MAWNNAVVTNNGVAMLQQVLTGETLIIDGAAGGTGTVLPAALMAQLVLKNQKQTLPIVGVTNVAGGKKLNVLITNKALVTEYVLQQVGIWAHVGSNPSALFAILQDETGIVIPASTDIPDFAMNFYAVINFSNESDFSFTVDTSALVNVGMMNTALEQITTQIDLHIADYVRNSGYAVTTGEDNNYLVSTVPAPLEYVDGMGIVIRVHQANTGEPTINWNGLGAIPIVDGKGNPLISGKMPLDGRLSLRYSSVSANFQLVGEGGEYGNATPDKVLKPFTIGTNEGIKEGTILSKAADAYNPSQSTQTINAGQYLAGNQIINPVEFDDSKVLNGTTIAGKVGTMTDNGPPAAETINLTTEGQEYTISKGFHSGLRKIKAVISGLVAGVIKKGSAAGGINGTYSDTSNPPAVGEVIVGKEYFENGNAKKVGTMPNRGNVGTINLNSEGSEYTIPAGYHNGLGKVKAVITGLIASVIKAGTTVGGILGTFTNDATATASQMLSGVTAWVKGVLVTGTIPSKSAATYTPSQSTQTISSGQYLSGNQTISAVSFDATKLLTGTTIAGTAGNMPNRGAVNQSLAINGSYTIPDGYHSGAGKVTQSITTKAAATYTPSQSTQTIAAGQYLSGAQTISAVSFDATKVLTGTTIAGKAGTMPNNGSQTSTLTITDSAKPTKSIPAGYTTGGTVTAQIDASQAGNIKQNVNLAGCVGTLLEFKRVTGTTGYLDNDDTIQIDLDFKPLAGLFRYVESDYYFSGFAKGEVLILDTVKGGVTGTPNPYIPQIGANFVIVKNSYGDRARIKYEILGY